ncbi:MAG: PKD-like domain-containing protein, partial [Bacteroidales bacterium]|nr:PKD-like domain-containing protein [Bacteroidales bacterium]
MKANRYSKLPRIAKSAEGNSGKAFFLILSILIFFLGLNPISAQNCSVNAGLPQSVCSGEQVILNGNSDGLIVGTTSWSQIAGPSAVIVSPTSAITAVTGTIGGNVYGFRISATCTDGSVVFQDVTVTVNPTPVANAGADQTYCPGTHSLSGSPIPSGGTGGWTIVGTNGADLSISTPASPTSDIVLPSNRTGSTTLRWTVNQGTCSSFDEVIITNRGSITPVSAGPPQTLSNCFSATTSASMAGSYAGTGIDGQSGLWTIVSGPSIPTIINPTAHNTTISGLIEGTYTFRWTVSGPCASGTDLVTVTVPSPAGSVTQVSIANANPYFCDGRTSHVFTGSQPLYANETVLWEQIAGLAGPVIQSPNSPTTLISGFVAGQNYTFRYSVTNSVTGCTSQATTTFGTSAVAVTFNLTTSAPLLLACNDEEATIGFNQTGPGNVQYSIISGPSGAFIYPTEYQNAGSSPTTITGFTQNGTYLVRFRKGSAGSSCDPIFRDIEVVASKPVTGSNAGTDQFVACNVTETTLAGNVLGPGDIGVGQWSQVSGPNTATIANPFLANTTVTGLTNGLYIFRWLVSAGDECTAAQDDVEVRVAAIPPADVTVSGPVSVCFGTPITLEGREPIINEIGTWTVDPPGTVTFSPNANSPIVVADGLAASTSYTFRWTIQNGCASKFAEVVVTTSATEGPLAAAAGADQCLPVATTSIFLQGNDPSPGAGLWTRISGPNMPTFTDATLYNTEVTGLVPGTYEFEWAITFGAGCPDSRDRVIISVWDITIANAGVDQDICGTSATFAANAAAVGETGVWSQVSGPGGYIISDINAPNATITGLIDGAYVFRWTISNGACSSFDDVRFRVSTAVPTTADAGTVADVCGATSVTMNANTPTQGTGVWSIVSAPGTPVFANATNPTTTVSGLIPGTYTFRWTISGGTYCTPSTDDVSFTVYPVANAGSDASYCDAVAVNLTGTVNSTGTWTFVSYSGPGPDVHVLAANAPNSATVTNLTTGVYVFLYTITAQGGCPETSDEVTITNLNTTDAAQITGPVITDYCDDPSGSVVVGLLATVPGVGTGSWSKVSGPAVSFVNANNNVTDVTLTGGAGIYLFRWTVTNGTCDSFDEIVIWNYAPPSIANAGPNQTAVCGFETVMAANLPVTGLGTWTQISKPIAAPDAVIESVILPNTIISGMGEGTYVFRWTITNGPVCSVSFDEVSITTLQPPTPADAGPDQNLCNATSTTLAANDLIFGTGEWSQVSGPTTVSFSNAADRNATVSNLAPGTTSGTYVLRWTTTHNGCISEDEMTIVTWAEPTTATASDLNLCLFQPVNLTGNTPTVGTGLWTQTGGATAVIVDPSSPTSAVVGLTAGSYQFTWTISNGPICTPSQAIANVVINPLPTLAEAGPDQFLCNTSTATMAGNTPTEGTGTWTFVSGGTGATITDPTSPTTNVTGIPAGTHRLRWTISTGGTCVDYFDEVNITRYPDLTVSGPIASSTYCAGGSQTLTVVASGGDGSGYTYQWFSSPTSGGPWTPIGGATNASYTTPTSLTVGNYYYRAEVANCTTVPSSEAHITVVADPAISVQPVGADICSGLTHAMSVTVTGNVPPGTLEYQWQTRLGTSGTFSNIGGATTSIYTTPTLTTTAPSTLVRQYRVRIRQSASGCETLSDPATVTVYPVPAVNSLPSRTICNNTSTNYTITSNVTGTTFAWTAALQSGTATGFADGSGSLIDQTLTNATTSPAVVRYTITPTGPAPTNCVGAPFTFDVTVNPTPDVIATPALQRICSGTASNIALTTNITGPTVTYSWTAALQSGTATGFSAASGNSIQQTLTNTGNIAAVVRYTITPAIGSCTGAPIDVDVTVNPSGQVNSITNQTLCNNGSTTDVNFSTTRTDGTTTYAWTNNNTSIGLAAAGSGDILSFTATNTGTSPVTATITVIPTYTNDGVSCVGPSINFTITVNPTAQVNNPGLQTWCNTASASLSFTTNRTGGTTTYAWTNNNTAIGLAASGSGNLSFTATNPGTAPISATIEVTPTFSNGGVDCVGPPETFTITINPSGQVNAIALQEICNGNPTNLISFSTNRSGGTTTYGWTNSNTAIGLAASGSGNISSFTAQNTGNTAIAATITVTPSFEGCTGTTMLFDYTVYPTPGVTSVETLTICTGNAVNYTPTSNVAGTVFNWTAVNTVGSVSGFTVSGSGPITDVLTNFGPANGVVTYTITPTGPAPLNCGGPVFYLVVNVVNCNPVIGAAKQLVSTTYNTYGTADVVYNIRIQNYGNLELYDIQVQENLETAFGAGNFQVLNISSTSFAVNTAFSGTAAGSNLLDNSGTSNRLAVGASTNIVLGLRILSAGNYSNQVTASANSVGGSVTDLSQNGSDPDPDGDGDPSNNSALTLLNFSSCSVVASGIVNTTCGNSAGQVILTGSEAGTVTLNGTSQPSPATFTNLQAGWYTASFTATATGCKAEINFEITNINSNLSGSVTAHTNVSCNGGSNGAITVTATGGTTPYSFSLNGGAGQPTGVFTGLAAGEYGVRITDANGCTYTVSFDIDQPTPLILSLSSKTNVLCHGASTGSAIVVASGGTTGYTYSVTAGPVGHAANVTGNVISNMIAGTYTVQVTDANGCTATLSVVITQPAATLAIASAIPVNPTCNNANDGSVSITLTGGTAPYSYAWSNGTNAQNAVGLIAGTYNVIVTDANGCQVTGGPYTLINPAAVTLTVGTIVNTQCNAAVGSVQLTANANGNITVGSTTLAATAGNPVTFTGLAAGYYTASFTATSGGCMATANFNIINTNSTLSASVTAHTNVSCNGGTNGAATITATGGTGPYTYLLVGIGTSNATGVFTGLAAGEYGVRITDAIGCTYTVSFDIDQPAPLILSLSSKTNVLCHGASTGSAIVVASGGTTGYTYSVTAGPNTPTVTGNVITGMIAGTYTVQVTDANGCTATLSVVITQPAA